MGLGMPQRSAEDAGRQTENADNTYKSHVCVYGSYIYTAIRRAATMLSQAAKEFDSGYARDSSGQHIRYGTIP